MLDTKINDLTKQRLEKLEKIKSLGLNPYPQPNLEDKQSCAEALEMLDKSVLVAGRIMSLRGHGKILFADIHDQTNKMQAFFQESSLGKEAMEMTKLLDLGDIVSTKGKVFKTQAGEITINVESFQILSKNIRPLPEKWHGLKDIEERYRQRYVDLIVNPEVRKVFETRTKILREMRRFLDDHGFLEVETPILQPIYGGASAKPFITHHNTLDMDVYLRISDELYLKRLIVGGFEKVYEVSKDFRNEGVSKFHNPEFTQIEFYWAYVDYDVLMKFTEKLVTHIIKLIKGDLKLSYQGTALNFDLPFKRIAFRDIILDKTGVDIDTIKTEKTFKLVLKEKSLKLDLKNTFGLGACFDALYKEFVRPHIIQPTFVTDYPACMIALAKRKENNPEKIASFQLIVCGAEFMKAYNELNDPKDQYDRWIEEEALAKKGAETAMQLDKDYIRALEYGMPPTAGWGMGIDRFTQLLTDQPTIKDVIFFPAMRNEDNSSSQSTPRPIAAKPNDPKKISISSNKNVNTNRERFLKATQTNLEKNIFYHSLAVEACMSGLYDYLKENNRLDDNELPKEDWLLAGLIHDIDYSADTKNEHPNKTREVLAKYGLEIDDTVDSIVKAHAPELTGVKAENLAQWSIFCADSLTGLITAVALIYPSKKLAEVKTSSVLKRFLKEPKFAAGTRRDEVKMCELESNLNIPLEKFIEICLTSMQQIAPEIGL